MNAILAVRLGAMGDILHALPAVASLKKSFPEKRIIWVVARKWIELLDGNPNIDELVSFDRQNIGALAKTWRRLRAIRPEIAIDFQGLIQSALVGRLARPKLYIGLTKSQAREPLAAAFYTRHVKAKGPHRIERNLQLVAAAGAALLTEESWLPRGSSEGELPAGSFILASPLAGWGSKQWPLSYYDELGKRLRAQGLELVANVPVESEGEIANLPHVRVHSSSISGLIDATRRAAGVVGVDSGPMHLAAALGKPGVALFGPTDPARNGPFRSRMTVLRAPDAQTTYKRRAELDDSMKKISAERVAEEVLRSLAVGRP
ncbi:MAG TPA: glycosyltransferase family 9 protein [Bryobacteraceae bacterium]|jgi:heptosyltransferase-1